MFRFCFVFCSLAADTFKEIGLVDGETMLKHRPYRSSVCFVKDADKAEAPAIRTIKIKGHVGFATFADQLVNTSIRNGFAFNILCIGETGVGKSTLMESLFNTSFQAASCPHSLPSVKLNVNTYNLEESNVRLKLTIVDTMGYGDQINKDNSCQVIEDYIDTQFESYLQEELRIKRSLSTFHDTRIHACVFFISPTGHGLKSIDIMCMKKLNGKVSIIPIIAKADTVSPTELLKFKKKIMQELSDNDIEIYYFPTDDETSAEVNAAMNSHLPFAVVGSTDFVRIGKKMVRAREYPWGTVEIENESHCDFIKLREMLIRRNMEDMREKTHVEHYELYRKQRLEEMGFADSDDCEIKQGGTFQLSFQERQNLHFQELQRTEDEIQQYSVDRFEKAELEFANMEKELYAKFDKLRQEYLEEKHRLDEVWKQLEEEFNEFDFLKNQITKQQATSSGYFTLGRNKRRS